MKTLYYILLIVIATVSTAVLADAQMYAAKDTAQTFVAHHSWDDNIHIFSDPRLAILVEKHKSLMAGGIRRMKGYRVQIYYGTDRAEAINRKVDFMRRYPRVKTYMTYTQPQYRIRVGDFATREDALELYRQAISLYGAAIIVPENVTINTLDDYDD